MKTLKDVIAELEIVLSDLKAIEAVPAPVVADEPIKVEVIDASGTVETFEPSATVPEVPVEVTA